MIRRLQDDRPADGGVEPNRHDIFKNNFGTHQDIRYFDPPLNSLTQLNIRVFTIIVVKLQIVPELSHVN